MNLQLEEELSEYPWDPVAREAVNQVDEDEALEGQSKKSRKLPEQWTRVISVFGDNLDQAKAYSTATDLLMAAGFQPLPFTAQEEPWKLLFSPKQFAIDNPDLVLDDYRLDVARLKDFGNHISDVREQIRALAKKSDAQSGHSIEEQIAITT